MSLVDFYGNPVRLSGPYRTYLPGTALAETITGTSGADLIGQNGSDVLIGLGGDDTYGAVSSISTIVEQVGGGTDTVYVFGDYVLPQNVENLMLVAGTTAWGNDIANYIVGNAEVNLLNGRSGNDVLTGGGGGDIFEFSAASGRDLVTDFQSGSDAVRLLGYSQFSKFSDVLGAMQQVGGDVVLTLSANDQVKFQNTQLSNFTAADFKLNLDRSNLVLSFEDQFDTLSLDSGNGGGTWSTWFDFGASSNSIFSRTLPGNGERQYYSDLQTTGSGTSPIGVNPFSIANSAVTISARPASATLQTNIYGLDFTSGLLTSHNSFAQQYGYFEARIDVPEGTGAWPAFWLLPADGSHPPELDIMENYGDNQVVYTAHSRNGGAYTSDSQRFANFDLSTGYHTFGMLWTASTITWYVDDVAIRTIATPDDAKRPMYMLLDLAVSSNAPVNLSVDMKVDYVRAYSLAPGFDDPLAVYFAPPVVVPPPPSGTIDVFVGTSANDNYTVDNMADQIIEQVSGGIDQVIASVDYILPANVENLALAGTAMKGTGNNSINTIIGSDLDNILDGLGGVDTLKGGKGNDTYYVDGPDTVFEATGEGRDIVIAAASFSLSNNVEDLTLVGSATGALGNGLANVIRANDLGNSLTGQAGNDQLFGGAGKDYLDGGSGTDEAYGAAGDDNYTVDSAGDLVIEALNDGRDSVWAYADYTLSANVEELWLFGAAIAGGGNSENNSLYGNDLNNALDGKAGDDWIDGGKGADAMTGGAGNDMFIVDNPGDSVIERPGEGSDTVWTYAGGVLANNAEVLVLVGPAIVGTGNSGNNTIIGNALNNVLDGGLGTDYLQGGAGSDIFRVGPGFGDDYILDFDVRQDVLDWSALKSQYGAPVLSQASDGVLAVFGGNTLHLMGLSLGIVSAYNVFGG